MSPAETEAAFNQRVAEQKAALSQPPRVLANTSRARYHQVEANLLQVGHTILVKSPRGTYMLRKLTAVNRENRNPNMLALSFSSASTRYLSKAERAACCTQPPPLAEKVAATVTITAALNALVWTYVAIDRTPPQSQLWSIA